MRPTKSQFDRAATRTAAGFAIFASCTAVRGLSPVLVEVGAAAAAGLAAAAREDGAPGLQVWV